MKTKPIFIKILCIFFLIEPLVKILYFKIATGFSFTLILSNILSRQGFMEIFSFWLAFPLAGLCLLKLRNWTYFLFMYLLIYNSYVIMTYERFTWPYNSDAPFFYNYILTFAALFVVALFILPVIREPFFNDKIRWWESRKRFKLGIEGHLFDGEKNIPVKIVNISYSGVLLQTDFDLEDHDSIILTWSDRHFDFSMPLTIVRRHTHGPDKYGARFSGHNFQDKLELYRYILDLEGRCRDASSSVREVENVGASHLK